jgi:hypothetical protein
LIFLFALGGIKRRICDSNWRFPPANFPPHQYAAPGRRFRFASHRRRLATHEIFC